MVTKTQTDTYIECDVCHHPHLQNDKYYVQGMVFDVGEECQLIFEKTIELLNSRTPLHIDFEKLK